MKVEIRKTAAGTEYWDTEAKKSLFVPTGKKPNFEVTKNPKSMLFERQILGEFVGPVFEDMTVAELRDYAKVNDIEIPADIKKKDDIIKLLSDSE